MRKATTLLVTIGLATTITAGASEIYKWTLPSASVHLYSFFSSAAAVVAPSSAIKLIVRSFRMGILCQQVKPSYRDWFSLLEPN